MRLARPLAAIAASLFMVTTANALTCTTVGNGNSGATFGITEALDRVCINNDNDKGDNGYFSANPLVFGTKGWKMGPAVTFDTAPINQTKSGTFGISNPDGYRYAVALKAGSGFGLFDMGTLSSFPDLFNWSSSKNLSHATVWYVPVSDVPIPAAGFLLLGGLGVLGLGRRRKS